LICRYSFGLNASETRHMLLKWIICVVPEEERPNFSRAQKHWSALADLDGFCGQIGGWGINDPMEACILGLWEHEDSYQKFMSEAHDSIAEASGQTEMYDSIAITMFEFMFDIPGRIKLMTDAIGEGSLLRIANCKVNTSREAHFTHTQQEVWSPSMKDSGGLEAGLFGRGRDDSGRFLTATIWQDVASHQSYADHKVPALFEKAEVVSDIQSISAYVIAIDSSWCVRPDRRPSC